MLDCGFDLGSSRRPRSLPMSLDPAFVVETVSDLELIYGAPGAASTVKVSDRIPPHYRAMIEASPFCALATTGPEGLDCSPRGDVPGFVRIHDERTLLMPDRRGN